MRSCLAALFVIFCCLAATQAIAERRVALVVGNARYAHTPALPNPRNDAQDIADTLRRMGFDVTLGYDLDQTKFAHIIDDFARALEGADVGLFFYAGHGLQINEKNYLVSTEAKLESSFLVPSETIELDAIIRLMESKANTNLIFLDACRNNPLIDNLKRNLTAINRSVNVSRGLARIESTGHDTLVAFSSAPGQEAADGRGRNSPFTASLLRHLPKPGLEVSVMLKEVTADVRRETNNAQRPQQLSDMSKKFYFVKAEPSAAAAPPITQPDPIELVFWKSAEAANKCESIRAYLRKYPEGSFEELALIYEDALCKAAPVAAHAPARILVPAARLPIVPDPNVPPSPADATLAAPAVSPTAPAAAAVQPPVAPGAGANMNVRKERAHHAARPSERERPAGAQHTDEPRRVDIAPKPSTRAENQMPDLKKGETWFYIGGKQCKTLGGSWGKGTNIICP
jgi:hypothetical protein